MWHSAKGVVLALALSATAATAQPLRVPRQPAPPGGACPVGYAWSGTFCLSLDGKRHHTHSAKYRRAYRRAYY